MGLRVLLADDHRIFREGLRPLLSAQADVEVVAEAEDGPGALAGCLQERPDIAVLDISMPGLSGLEVARRLAEEAPEIRVIFLSMHGDRQYVLEALKVGARGYLLKEDGFTEFLAALRTVESGHIYLGDAIREQVVQGYVALAESGPNEALARLTARERQVLKLLTEGLAAKQVADELNLSVKTVESHRKSIMDKLEIRSIAELTKYAIREGLTGLE